MRNILKIFLLYLLLAPSLPGQGVINSYRFGGGGGGGTQTTESDTVTANNHDATSDPGDENLIYDAVTYSVIATAYDPGPSQFAYLVSSSVPQGAQLDSAIGYLFFGTSDHPGTRTVSIFGFNVDNCPVFDGTHTHQLDAHATLTADSVVMTIPVADFEVVRTPNLAALLQPIIDRVGYAQNNNVGILFRVYPEWTSGEFQAIFHHEDSGNPDRWPSMKWTWQ